MEHWDYKQITLSPEQIEDTLQRYGSGGWELASLVAIRHEKVFFTYPEAFKTTEYIAIFKRRRNNPGNIQ